MPINAYQPLDEVAWMSTFRMAIVGHGMRVIISAAASCEVPRARDTEFEEIVVETMETERLACKKTVLRRCFFWRSPYMLPFLIMFWWPLPVTARCIFLRFGFTNDPDGYLLLKVSQLIELLEIRHSVFLMGNPGSGMAAVERISRELSVSFKSKSHETAKIVWQWERVVLQILQLLHHITPITQSPPLEPIHYKGATACHREASSPSSGRCWRAPRPSEATRPPWWTSAPRPLPPTSCTLAFKRWGNVGNMI